MLVDRSNPPATSLETRLSRERTAKVTTKAPQAFGRAVDGHIGREHHSTELDIDIIAVRLAALHIRLVAS